MQSLIVLDIDTAEKVMVAVAGGVGYVICPVKTMFRNQHAWELRGSKAQCDYLEVACIALDVIYYRIDTTTEKRDNVKSTG